MSFKRSIVRFKIVFLLVVSGVLSGFSGLKALLPISTVSAATFLEQLKRQQATFYELRYAVEDIVAKGDQDWSNL